jgi:hypothetical protein
MNESSERRSGTESPKERDYDRVTLSSPEKKSVAYNKISQTLLDMIVKGAVKEDDAAE